MHRYGNLLEIGNRENVKQVHEHHNRLVDLFRRVTSDHHIRRKEEQLVLEAVDEQKPSFRCSIAPRVHQKIVNLKGATVGFGHLVDHRGQLAVTVGLVEILEVQVSGDALNFTADVVFKHIGQLFQLGLAQFTCVVTKVLNGVVQINGVYGLDFTKSVLKSCNVVHGKTSLNQQKRRTGDRIWGRWTTRR